MHVFTFGGLSLSSADYTLVGRSCSSRRGGERLVRGVRRGFCVSCHLARLNRIDSPCLADMRALISLSHHSEEVEH